MKDASAGSGSWMRRCDEQISLEIVADQIATSPQR